MGKHKQKPTVELPTFEDRELIEDGVKVTFEYIGEGWCGDYNPEDSEDTPLLRFNVFAHESLKNPFSEESPVKDGYGYMLDSSYCTGMPINTPKEIIDMALRSIMDEICDDVRIGRSIKKKCEMLSWLKPSYFKMKA